MLPLPQYTRLFAAELQNRDHGEVLNKCVVTYARFLAGGDMAKITDAVRAEMTRLGVYQRAYVLCCSPAPVLLL